MKLIFRYMKKYTGLIALAIAIKFVATVCELLLPYILEHIIDDIVPLQDVREVVRWGILMFLTAVATWGANAGANRLGIWNAHNISFNVRRDLFEKTMYLSGKQFDSFGLPSLTSRMTSDSYNVQAAAQQLQTLCVRAPMMLIGGLAMMLFMNAELALILVALLPVLFAIIFLISSRGIPLFNRVQQKLDNVVRIMRENITGIRVVKALSKVGYEERRFGRANDEMMESDIHASTTMAIPGPLIQLLLNIGLSAVVVFGAVKVNAGTMDSGVILAFLTYFNMIAMGVMGVNRIFISLSKASASANRMREVIDTPVNTDVLTPEEGAVPSGDGFIRFEHVTFSYAGEAEAPAGEGKTEGTAETGNRESGRIGGTAGKQTEQAERFAGGRRENALEDISFSLNRGESLGIIGPTGCGKTTIINLMMRFYDAGTGAVFVDGRDVRTYDRKELREKFGTVFQNDMIFKDTLENNISFHREIEDRKMIEAAEDAQVADYINSLPEGYAYEANIQGANLSGGQKQRILVARALAGNPEILVLDDSSSALDYRTDAKMRKAIQEHHQDTTLILIAQRVSSVMNMTHIMVMDEGRCVGYGTHEELLKNCRAYKEIYDIQMGAMSE